MIDATASSDAEGEPLTWTLEQVAGPVPSDVPLDEDEAVEGEGMFAFRTPEVDEDTLMEFELTVSDGEDITMERISITIQNIELTPTKSLLGEVVASFEGLRSPDQADFFSMSFGDHEIGVNGIADADDGSGRILFRYRNDYVTEEFSDLETIPLEGSIAGEKAILKMEYLNGFSPTLLIGLKESDRIHVKEAFAQIVETEAPCAFSLPSSSVHDAQKDLLVGSKGGGLKIFQFDKFPRGTFAPGEEPMLVAGPVLASTGNFCFANTWNSNIIGYDETAGLLRFWNVVWGGEPDEMESVPISLPEGVPLLDADLFIDNSGHFVAAFLSSDDVHEGQHDLWIYANQFDGSGPVRVKKYSWDKGVPSDVTLADLNPGDVDSQEDVVVTLETVPYLIYIEQTGDSSLGHSRPGFGDLTYVPSTLWNTSVRKAGAPDFTTDTLVLTQTRTGKVSMMELTPD